MCPTPTNDAGCVCCQTNTCALLEDEVNQFADRHVKDLALIGLNYVKTQKGAQTSAKDARLTESDIEYFKQALLQKHGGDISSLAHQAVVKQNPNAKPGSAEYAALKKHHIGKIINNAFQRFSKPPANWTSDPSYFFNRRTEQGFTSKQQTAERLSGLFGDLLYDIVYPKWWGGLKGSWIYDQTMADGVSTKVNNQPPAGVSQSYNRSVVPVWHQHYPPGSTEKPRTEHAVTAHRPKSATQERKVNPALLIPAGVTTIGKGSQWTVDQLQDPQYGQTIGQNPHHTVQKPLQFDSTHAHEHGRIEPGRPIYSPFLQPSDYHKVPLDQLYPPKAQRTTAHTHGLNDSGHGRPSSNTGHGQSNRGTADRYSAQNPYLTDADAAKRAQDGKSGARGQPQPSERDGKAPDEFPLLPPAIGHGHDHVHRDEFYPPQLPTLPQSPPLLPPGKGSQMIDKKMPRLSIPMPCRTTQAEIRLSQQVTRKEKETEV